jgi:hypothetical protein
MRGKKIPTLLAILIVVIGIAAGVVLIQRNTIYRLGADSASAPQDVRITNVNDSSFTVSWTTPNESSGFVVWGENQDKPSKIENDELQEKGFTHLTTIRGLKPSTPYSFRINSNGAEFDNNGVNWSVTTGAQLATPDEVITATGTVVDKSGVPSANTLVYMTIGGASPMSTVTSKSGSWVIPVSSMRTQDLSSYIPIDKNNDILEIFVQATPSDSATGQVYVAGANPTPPITLGQENNFKSVSLNVDSENPEANLDLPETISEKESKFNVSDATPTDVQEKVTLESIDNGEVISSDRPEFFGDGPKGTDIIITVESEKIEGSAKVGSSGTWKWSVPDNLEQGTHKVTVSWRDDNGILRTISKTFIVQAAENNPAFEATPSATPTTTPGATQTPTPKPTAASTGAATPVVTPTDEPEVTEPPVPDSGTLTPTLVLSIMGVALLLLSSTSLYFAYKKDE